MKRLPRTLVNELCLLTLWLALRESLKPILLLKRNKGEKRNYKYKLYYKYKLSPLFPYAAIIDMIFTLDLCMTLGEM